MLLPFLCRIGNEVAVYPQSNLSVIQILFIIRFAFLIGKVLTQGSRSYEANDSGANVSIPYR